MERSMDPSMDEARKAEIAGRNTISLAVSGDVPRLFSLLSCSVFCVTFVPVVCAPPPAARRIRGG